MHAVRPSLVSSSPSRPRALARVPFLRVLLRLSRRLAEAPLDALLCLCDRLDDLSASNIELCGDAGLYQGGDGRPPPPSGERRADGHPPCLFGPGGDYARPWPISNRELAETVEARP